MLSTQMFPRLPAHATFVSDTNFVSGTQKMFLILFRNILCTQQMFPSLRRPRNIMGNNVPATMCPRLPGPFGTITLRRRKLITHQSPATLDLRLGKLRQGNMMIIVTSSFSKCSFLKMFSVHTKTYSRRFQIPPVHRAFL